MSTTPFPYLTVCLAAACLASSLRPAASRSRAREERFDLLSDALDHMSQGLCMFDAAGRIVVCNRQYLRMYKLSPEVVKPGCTLRELIEHRKQNRIVHRRSRTILQRDHGQHRGRQDLEVGRERQRRPHRSCHQRRRCPTAAGSRRTRTSPNSRSCSSSATTWPSSRNAAASVDAAIAAFRTGMERCSRHLRRQRRRDESDGGDAFGRRQSRLAVRHQRGRGIKRSFDRGKDAAGATDELSNSIAEIARQITQTNSVVRIAVDEAQSTDGEMTTLAEFGAEDRRHRQAHPDHRRADQSAGAQRHDRSGARRRSGPRLRRRRLGSQIAGRADRQGDGSDRRADPRGAGIDRRAPSSRSGASPSACTRSSIMRRASPPRSSSRSAATGNISSNVASAARAAETVAEVLSDVAGAAAQTHVSAEIVLDTSQSVEAASRRSAPAHRELPRRRRVADRG